MSNDREDAAAVAKGLTEAQRKAVLSGGYNDDNSLTGRQRPMFYKMTEAGLFASARHGPLARSFDYRLTELGLAVRRELERNKP